MDDPLISIAQAAREVGVNKSTLARQVKAGLIRSHDGLVRLSEVLEDRAKNIDHSMARRGQGAPDARKVSPLHQDGDATLAVDASDDDDEAADAGKTVFVDGAAMPLGKAKALKETYLARLRQIEFELKSGRLVDAEEAEKTAFEISRGERDALLNWPARVAPLIAAELGADQVKLGVALERHVREFLLERSDAIRRGG